MKIIKTKITPTFLGKFDARTFICEVIVFGWINLMVLSVFLAKTST